MEDNLNILSHDLDIRTSFIQVCHFVCILYAI